MPIPEDYSSPTRLSAKERAFSQMQQWIIDGTFHPGEKLIDAELAEALGVSRTPVREALQLLETQGFVKTYPGRATQVTPIENKDIQKILPPLAALQALSAELAASAISQQTVDSLRAVNSDFAQAVDRGDFFSALKLDEKFHRIIVEVTGNGYLLNMVSTLQAHVRRLFFNQSIILTPTSIEEHEAILQAFESRDQDTAASIMRTNWLRPIEEFNSRLQG